ncbi:MAG TPA: hypothetical protein PL112_19085, partial [Candidatus Obscuribacter sp.]|nr:hypothetical protein [Candidatus Obscuribacter sp.]
MTPDRVCLRDPLGAARCQAIDALSLEAEASSLFRGSTPTPAQLPALVESGSEQACLLLGRRGGGDAELGVEA